MKSYFLNLFDFNDWCNRKTMNLLFGIEDEKVISLMSHIISLQDTWLERLKETENYSIDIRETYSLPELVILSEKSTKGWIKFISKLRKDGFTKNCTYNSFVGRKSVNTYQDIMTSVISHSIHHRAQINSILTMNSIELVDNDYILFLREKSN